MKSALIIIALLVSQLAFAKVETTEVGGYMIEYEVKGEGDEVVLLEAGGGGGLADWPVIFDRLSQTTKVIRYSRVGNGNSEKTNTLFVVEDYVQHLSSLLAELGISKIIYVAHSYGGNVARVFAAKHPKKVAALLLIDASSEHDVDIMRAINLEQANKEIAAVKLSDIQGGKNYHIVDFWAKFPLPDYPQIKDIPVTVIASVKRYEAPAHLLHSDKGREMWGEHWTQWAEAFPQGKAVLTTSSYHLIPQEEPALVVQEVNELVQRVRANKKLQPMR